MRKNRAGVTPWAAIGAPKCGRACPEPPAALGTDPCVAWCRAALGAEQLHMCGDMGEKYSVSVSVRIQFYTKAVHVHKKIDPMSTP